MRCLEQHQTLLSLQRIGAWSLFNLLDGQPRPTVDVATVNMVSERARQKEGREGLRCGLASVWPPLMRSESTPKGELVRN